MKKLKFVEDNKGVRIPWTYLHTEPYKDYKTDLIDFENVDIVLESEEYKNGKDCQFECVDKYGNKATLFMSKSFSGMVGLVILHSDENHKNGAKDVLRMSHRY